MKKVRFLLLSVLTIMLMTFAMGCEVAGDNCTTDGDCKTDGDSCYAGYCGAQEPVGLVNLKFNLRNSETNDALHCNEANVDNVDVTVTVHGDEVFKTTVACKDLNVHELDSQNMGYPVAHLWSEKDYDFTVKFTDSVSKSFVAVPKIGGVEAPGAANDANVVKLEKIQEATFTAKWDIEEADGTLNTDSSSCTKLGIDNFRVALDELNPCDENGQCDFSNFVSIPCSDLWQTGIVVREATGRSIGIYAVSVDTNTGGLSVPFSIEKAITITQAQLDGGAFERTFHLDDKRGNK